MSKHLTSISLLFLANAAFSISYAQSSTPYKLDEIIVRSSNTVYDEHNLKSYVKSGSYSYLDQSDINKFRGSSVGDFLTGVPGVIAGNKRNSGALSVNIRGIANEGRVPVIVDNAMQSVPSWQGYAGSSSRTYLDPDLISNVEIEKGASMEADATGAIGGVIRMKTIDWKDIIPTDKDWGIRLRLGTMDNTVSPPAYYTKGGYQTRYIADCGKNAAGLCKTQTYSPNANYSSKSPHFNSYNFSVAFAKKWEHGDVVLAYAKRKQGNYFVGRHGQLPEIKEHQKTSEDESFNYDVADVLKKLGKNSLSEITDQEKEANGITVYDYPTYKSITKEGITVGKIKFKENHSTLYRPGEEALNTSQNNRSFLAKTNLYYGNHRISLGYNRYHSEFGEIMPSILNFRAFGALQGEGTEIKVNSYNFGYHYNPNTSFVDFDLNTYYTHVDSSNFTPFLEEYGYSRSSRHAHFSDLKQWGLNLKNSTVFNLNSKPMKLNYGFSYSHELLDLPKDAQARVKEKGYPDDAIAPLYIRRGKRIEKSLFMNAHYPIFSLLKADIGLRYTDTTIQDYQPLVKFGNLDPTTGKNKTTFEYQQPIKINGFSPIAMLSLDLPQGIQFYLKHARAIKAPSLFQGTKGWSMQNTENNLDQLKPERTNNWEVGLNLFFENIANSENVAGFKLSYFQNNIRDYLTRTNTDNGTTQTINIYSAKFYGLESSAYFDMQKFYAKLATTYYTKVNFCLNQTECVTSIHRSNLNNQVPPKLTTHLTLGTRWLDNKLDIGGRYSYYSKRFVPVLSSMRFQNTSSIEWNPYSLVDLYANYQVTNNLKLSFNIDNLFNRYYLDTNNMGLNTAPGRTMRLGLDYKF